MKGIARSLGLSLALAGAALILGGCNTDPEPAPPAVTGQVDASVRELYVPEAQAGVDLDQATASQDLPTVRGIAANRSWDHRADPFSLLAAERRFEQEQQLENILGQSGYSQYFELPDESAAEEGGPRPAPVPRWRLAGIVVSEGAIIALLDQGGGKVDTIIPGQYVEGTEWRCISIDTEKAVFRRDPSQYTPSIITVPLQGSIPGQVGGGNAPAGTGGGNTGQPSAPPAGGGPRQVAGDG